MPGGRETWQEEMSWQNEEKRHSWFVAFLVCHDPGNEKKFDPGFVPWLELRNITFSHSSPGVGWLSILSSGELFNPNHRQPSLACEGTNRVPQH